jgi:dipeptidyl aminopeptidase/acylaminoacyl peptidase
MKRSILLLALLGATLIFATSGIDLAESTTPDTQQDGPVASVAEGGNERIAFSNDSTGDHDVYTMRPDGSDQKNLTNSPGVYDYHVHVSPDGSQIVFERAPTVGFEADIWVMNADGSGMHKITNHPANDRHPSWHPDSERIVFMSDRDAASPWPVGDMDLYCSQRCGWIRPGPAHECFRGRGAAEVFAERHQDLLHEEERHRRSLRVLDPCYGRRWQERPPDYPGRHGGRGQRLVA